MRPSNFVAMKGRPQSMPCALALAMPAVTVAAIRGTFDREDVDQSSLRPANFTTLAHFSVSSAMNLALTLARLPWATRTTSSSPKEADASLSGPAAQAFNCLVLQSRGALPLGNLDGGAERRLRLSLLAVRRAGQQFAMQPMQLGAVESLAGGFGQDEAVLDRFLVGVATCVRFPQGPQPAAFRPSR
jgi:hypothetical protein